MKKVLSLFVVFFCFIGSSNLKAEIALINYSIKPIIYTYCSDFATYAATSMLLQGGNYYSTYFSAYSFCIQNIDPI